MDSQVRKHKNKGVGKEKDLHDLSTKLGNIIPDRRDGVSYLSHSYIFLFRAIKELKRYLCYILSPSNNTDILCFTKNLTTAKVILTFFKFKLAFFSLKIYKY